MIPAEVPDPADARAMARKIIESGKASDTMDETFLRAAALLPAFEQARIKMDLAEKFRSKFVRSEWMNNVRMFRPVTGPEETNGNGHHPATGLPSVHVTSRQLRDITRDTLALLFKANDPPFVFVRAGEICHVVRDEVGRPSVLVAREAWTRGILAREINWLRTNQFGEMKGTFPPKEVVSDVLTIDNPPFPPLGGVTEVPTLRPDGSAITTPGYDAESSIFYSPSSSLTIFPLPDRPSQTQVIEARSLIEEAIGEFPYAEQSSKANVYGLLLTPVLRPAIFGCTPIAVVDAPQAGTGKSLLIDVLSIITTGRPAAMVPYPYREEEMAKQIFSSLIAGRQLIAFDNLEGELKSPYLALAITAKEFNSRVLGLSMDKTVPNMSTWVVTGNNIKPAGDMPRRCYHIRLNAKQSKPYTGREFKHPDLLRWVSDNRSELLHALLILARYWFSSGSPDYMKKSIVGSFEDWHRKIGGIVTHARIPGFLENYSTFIDQEDEVPAQWEHFLAELDKVQWKDENGLDTRMFTVAAMLDEITRPFSKLKDHLPVEVADCLEQKNHRIIIGKKFQRKREVRFGTLWIERIISSDDGKTGHKGAALWQIRSIQT